MSSFSLRQKNTELLDLKAWWRIPLFGYSRCFDGYFDPLPFEDGVPGDVSETVQFDIAGPCSNEERQPEPLNEYFSDPEMEAQYITYDKLEAIDWDEPRNDVLTDLADLEGQRLEDELLMNAFQFELRDEGGTVLDAQKGNLSREAKLAAIERTTEYEQTVIEQCRTDVPDTLRAGSGPIQWNDGYLHAVRPTRRDYLPPEWFTVLDLMAQRTEAHSVAKTQVRLFSYFS